MTMISQKNWTILPGGGVGWDEGQYACQGHRGDSLLDLLLLQLDIVSDNTLSSGLPKGPLVNLLPPKTLPVIGRMHTIFTSYRGVDVAKHSLPIVGFPVTNNELLYGESHVRVKRKELVSSQVVDCASTPGLPNMNIEGSQHLKNVKGEGEVCSVWLMVSTGLCCI